MRNVALTWQQAAAAACTLKLVSTIGRARWALSHSGPPAPDTPVDNTPPPAIRSATERWRSRAVAAIGEVGTVSGLYAVWQFAGTAPVFDTAGAFRRAEAIERLEQLLRLPSEHSAQSLVLPHDWLTQAANLYYATMHFGALFALLAWVYFFRRDHYAQVRAVLITVTLGCLFVQLVPVAPPRLLAGRGYVDTAQQYGQSVYTAFAAVGPDQLSAMPSVHVAWAALAGIVLWRLGTGRWRYVGLLHAARTVFVVAATANHFWADGIAAAGILYACDYGVARTYRTGRLPAALKRTAVAPRPDRPVVNNATPR